jgi:hypothetical protein
MKFKDKLKLKMLNSLMGGDMSDKILEMQNIKDNMTPEELEETQKKISEFMGSGEMMNTIKEIMDTKKEGKTMNYDDIINMATKITNKLKGGE